MMCKSDPDILIAIEEAKQSHILMIGFLMGQYYNSLDEHYPNPTVKEFVRFINEDIPKIDKFFDTKVASKEIEYAIKLLKAEGLLVESHLD